MRHVDVQVLSKTVPFINCLSNATLKCIFLSLQMEFQFVQKRIQKRSYSRGLMGCQRRWQIWSTWWQIRRSMAARSTDCGTRGRKAFAVQGHNTVLLGRIHVMWFNGWTCFCCYMVSHFVRISVPFVLGINFRLTFKILLEYYFKQGFARSRSRSIVSKSLRFHEYSNLTLTNDVSWMKKILYRRRMKSRWLGWYRAWKA